MSSVRRTLTLKAPPDEVFSAIMDSRRHSRISEMKARISRKVGGKFSIFGGEVKGETIELVPDKRLVQTWRHNIECWPEGHNSKVTFLLKNANGRTLISFSHTGIPDRCFPTISKGWKEWYWTRVKEALDKKG